MYEKNNAFSYVLIGPGGGGKKYLLWSVEPITVGQSCHSQLGQQSACMKSNERIAILDSQKELANTTNKNVNVWIVNLRRAARLSRRPQLPIRVCDDGRRRNQKSSKGSSHSRCTGVAFDFPWTTAVFVFFHLPSGRHTERHSSSAERRPLVNRSPHLRRILLHNTRETRTLVSPQDESTVVSQEGHTQSTEGCQQKIIKRVPLRGDASLSHLLLQTTGSEESGGRGRVEQAIR